MLPSSGDVLFVGKAASVQFADPILFRVIRRHEYSTYDGWIWLDGYELNSHGDAVERRSIFVQIAGLRSVGKAPDPRTRASQVPQQPKRPGNGAPRAAQQPTGRRNGDSPAQAAHTPGRART